MRRKIDKNELKRFHATWKISHTCNIYSKSGLTTWESHELHATYPWNWMILFDVTKSEVLVRKPQPADLIGKQTLLVSR